MLTLTTKLTAEGIECSHEVVGKVATIKRELVNGNNWFVFPYRLTCYDHGKRFVSLEAAKTYALALAYETHENGLVAAPARAEHEKADPVPPVRAVYVSAEPDTWRGQFRVGEHWIDAANDAGNAISYASESSAIAGARECATKAVRSGAL